MSKKTILTLLSIPLMIALTGAILTGAQSEIPDVTNLVTLEGVITEIRPNEYYSFKVAYYLNDHLTESWCTPSTFFTQLYANGTIEVNETHVIALVDKSAGTGTVFDSIPKEPEPEPIIEPKPQPEPVEEPVEEPQPSEDIVLPNGLVLVSETPGPTPGLVAPAGKVKLTIMIQPSNLPQVTVYPPPGVYYADEGAKILFTCNAENPSWVFTYWNIGMGVDGSLRKPGIGAQHYLRVTVDRDMVVTAFLNQEI